MVAEKKDEYLTTFKGNRAGLVLIVGDMKKVGGKAPTVTNELTETGEGVISAELKAKGWRDLEQEEPSLAKKIMSDHNELYKAMYKEEYQVDAPVAE